MGMSRRTAKGKQDPEVDVHGECSCTIGFGHKDKPHGEQNCYAMEVKISVVIEVPPRIHLVG